MPNQARDVHSLLAPKDTWTKPEFMDWLKAHGFRWSRISSSPEHWRAGQRRTGDFITERDGGNYRTFVLPRTDVKLLFGSLRPGFSPRRRKLKLAEFFPDGLPRNPKEDDTVLDEFFEGLLEAAVLSMI